MTERAHLDEATWERLACGELTAFERDQALKHVLTCTRCSAIHRALLVVEKEAAEFDTNVPPSLPADARPSRVDWRWLSLAAASVAAAVALVVALRPGVSPRQPGPSTETVRAGQTTSPTAVAPVNGADLSTDGFRWTAVTDADGYRVRVSVTDGRTVWESAIVRTTQTAVPADARIAPGNYFWTVTALRGTTELGTSALTRVRIAP